MTFDQSDQEFIEAIKWQLGQTKDDLRAILEMDRPLTQDQAETMDKIVNTTANEIAECVFALSDFLEGMNNRRER